MKKATGKTISSMVAATSVRRKYTLDVASLCADHTGVVINAQLDQPRGHRRVVDAKVAGGFLVRGTISQLLKEDVPDILATVIHLHSDHGNGLSDIRPGSSGGGGGRAITHTVIIAGHICVVNAKFVDTDSFPYIC